MKSNQGVTLIEFIVVLLMVGVLATGAAFGMGLINSGTAQSTAERINAILDYVQVENMTKNNRHYMIINQDADGSYYLSIEDLNGGSRQLLSREKLKLRQGEITFEISGDTTEYLVSSGPVVGRHTRDTLEVCFNKVTGGIAPNSIGPSGEIVTNIKISGSSRTYTIRLVRITGKHYIE